MLLASFMAASLLLRLLFVVRSGPDGAGLTTPDTISYLGPAESLLRDWSYSVSPGSTEPMWVRTPGYPVFVAALIAVVGTGQIPLALAQSAVLLVLLPLVYLLGATIASRRVGLAAAALCALEPLVSFHSVALLTEGLMAVLLTSLALTLVIALRLERSGHRWWLVVGLLITATTMVRPTTYYFGMVLVLAVFVHCGRKLRRLGPALVSAGLVAIPQIVILGTWQWRNLRAFGSPRLSSIEAVNMYFFRGGGVVARREGLSFGAAKDQLSKELPDPSTFPTQGAYFDEMYSRGIDIVTSHPIDYAIVAIEGLISSAIGPGREPLNMLLGDRVSLAAAAVYLVTLCLLWLFVATYLWFAVRERTTRTTALWLASIPAYVLLISAGPESYGRFRAPVIPILVVMATVGAAELLRRWRASRADGNNPVPLLADGALLGDHHVDDLIEPNRRGEAN